MGDNEYPERASLDGFVSEVFKVVSRGATPDRWAEWLREPLEHAAAEGNIDLFNALIGAGADGSAGWRGYEGRTLFDAAAAGGSAEVVSGLVAAGAQTDVNVVSASSGTSALYLATSLGHEDAARRLVAAGADVNFRNSVDESDVLTQAVEGELTDLVNDLVLAGADPDTRCAKLTPLHRAAQSGPEGMVSTLLARGADKDARDDSGWTPLMKAAEAGHLAVVKSLLAAGADVGMRSVKVGGALNVAARNGHLEVLRAIIAHGAPVNANFLDRGSTALHSAARRDQVGALEVLIEAGADMELKDAAGWTPFNAAMYDECFHAVRALLQHGASPSAKDIHGHTPLHIVCLRRCPGVDTSVDLLLRAGADETIRNRDGRIPKDLLRSSHFTAECSPEEEGRARSLLTRAPQDRAWRRRGWLVMLDDWWIFGGYGEGHGFDPPGDRDEGEASAVTPGESGAVAEAGDGCAMVIGGEGGSLRAVVEPLVKLQHEDVFRTVVGFL